MNKFLKLKTWTDYVSYKLSRKYKCSYSQNGEDIIIDSAVRRLKIARPTYIDIGTNHPIFKNNTYLFYTRGSRGVLVEPDPNIFRVIRKTRTGDTCLNVGIGPENEKGAPYYIMTSHQLSTFKKEEAEGMVASKNYGTQKIESVIHIPLVAINTLMEQYFPHGPDILSIDTEGYDLEILKSLDLAKYAPKILCVETLRFDDRGVEQKQSEILEYLLAHGYKVYADTFINTIFVRADR
ncbi:MAG: FkbM family methyltransferase [Candidatus Paceibacterota bacterium]|jgi:FkbM family methyltransferase